MVHGVPDVLNVEGVAAEQAPAGEFVDDGLGGIGAVVGLADPAEAGVGMGEDPTVVAAGRADGFDAGDAHSGPPEINAGGQHWPPAARHAICATSDELVVGVAANDGDLALLLQLPHLLHDPQLHLFYLA